jgi:hypothetical protein
MRPEREANHSPPSSAEVKNAWGSSIHPYVFMVWCLIKHMSNFTSHTVYIIIALALRRIISTKGSGGLKTILKAGY